jgi:predicted RNA-binding protein YlxR (DUF448 family)
MAPKVRRGKLQHDLFINSDHLLRVIVLQRNAVKVETAEERAAWLEKEAIFAQEAAKLRQEAARARILERHLREQVRYS